MLNYFFNDQTPTPDFIYFFQVVFCRLCEFVLMRHNNLYWTSPQSILWRVDTDTGSSFWPISDWNNSSRVLKASCCHLPVLFVCPLSDTHNVPCKLSQPGTLWHCVQLESSCYELPMTTLELIAIDGYLSTVFFSLSADLLEAVCSQTTVSSFSLHDSWKEWFRCLHLFFLQF